ncbi:GMP synthase, glutamine amidotransferase domain [Cenarchaeum symbiosum A]|uniref:GMP synthase, glutamine amidotransferase domain n=1 Tax=Cenarchaeum symbiosum (strain A) TaxID=414004 RepID=A0RYX1_CENSY|nr:GMP synthase, glutamine amidotransferase domain [Cenarchaeum symbiosum A]
MLLLLDNGSIFTRQIADLLHAAGAIFRRVSPAELGPDDAARFDSYILSGRRRNDAAVNAFNSRIIRHALSRGKPLLGICYGAEIMALTLGGTIRRTGARRGYGSVRVHGDNPLCGGEVTVFESHSFEIARLAGPVVGLASSSACEHEMIHARGSKMYGTQFHPEMSDDGRGMIRRFLSV